MLKLDRNYYVEYKGYKEIKGVIYEYEEDYNLITSQGLQEIKDDILEKLEDEIFYDWINDYSNITEDDLINYSKIELQGVNISIIEE